MVTSSREFLKNGLVKGLPKPERHIETWLSDIFLYEDVVRKAVKHVRDEHIGDFTNLQERRRFYEADFAWNKQFTPDIHEALQGIRETANGVEVCSVEEGEDFFIRMKRINADDTLLERLVRSSVTKEQVTYIAKTLLDNLAAVNDQYLTTLQQELGKNVYELLLIRMENLRVFISSAPGVSKEKTHARADQLLAFVHSHPYFKSLTNAEATVTIDGHSANIVFIENVPVFMDVYFPMPAFRIVDRALPIAKVAACVRVFAGDTLADSMYAVYAERNLLPPKSILDFYEAYNAYIMGYYFIHLTRPELVKPYFEFADAHMTSLQT